MKRLLLTLLLASSTASAVNLSELKASDVCYTKIGNITSTFNDVIDKVKNPLDIVAPELEGVGIKSSTNQTCKYRLGALMHYNIYASDSSAFVEIIVYLSEAKESYLHSVDNSYFSNMLFKYVNTEESYKEVAAQLVRMYTAFIRDWKQAHP